MTFCRHFRRLNSNLLRLIAAPMPEQLARSGPACGVRFGTAMPAICKLRGSINIKRPYCIGSGWRLYQSKLIENSSLLFPLKDSQQPSALQVIASRLPAGFHRKSIHGWVEGLRYLDRKCNVFS